MSQEEMIEQCRMFEKTGLWIRAEMAKLERLNADRSATRGHLRAIAELCARNTANQLATVRF